MSFTNLLRIFVRNRSKRATKSLPQVEAAQRVLMDALLHDLDEMGRHADMQRNTRPYVMLAPAVPLPSTQTDGWFGGSPRLPASAEWPVIDGEPARFVCQIDLSALPQNIWSGVGPREGHLSLFLHPRELKAAVLHVVGALGRHDGPGQKDAAWFRNPTPFTQAEREHSPEWPIRIEARIGPFPDHTRFRKGMAPGKPDPRASESFDLADPAFHPFDGDTLTDLLGAIRKQFRDVETAIERLRTAQLKQEDRAALDRSAEFLVDTSGNFERIADALAPSILDFEAATVARHVSDLANLRMPAVRHLATDDNGNTVIEVFDLPLCETGKPLLVRWPTGYLRILYERAVNAYVRAPADLPSPQKKRFERLWSFEAEHETGAMGHASRGVTHHPYGPDTPNEMLLELPSSELVGWVWGDRYSVALLIDRQALAEGRFDNVMVSITN